MSHFTEGQANTSFELNLAIIDGRLERWKNNVADLLRAEILKTMAQAGDGGVLDLRLVVIKQQVERLDQVVIGDVAAEGLSELGEVPREA